MCGLDDVGGVDAVVVRVFTPIMVLDVHQVSDDSSRNQLESVQQITFLQQGGTSGHSNGSSRPLRLLSSKTVASSSWGMRAFI